MRTGRTENRWKLFFQKSETIKGSLNLDFYFLNENRKGSFKMVMITGTGGSYKEVRTAQHW